MRASDGRPSVRGAGPPSRGLLAAALGLLLAGCDRVGAPGQPCRWHSDCQALPEGYCARVEVCTRECRDDLPCPPESRCVAGGSRSTCLATCARDGDCARGLACRDGVCQVADLFAPVGP